jgi:hypothetical protein
MPLWQAFSSNAVKLGSCVPHHTMTMFRDSVRNQAEDGLRPNMTCFLVQPPTASITGGYVAARLAVERLIASGKSSRAAVLPPICAVSVGIVKGKPCLDLDYVWDSTADVDMNVVMNGEGNLIEVQGTAEGQAFSRDELTTLLDLAASGIESLRQAQDEAIAKGLANRPNMSSS